MPGDNVQMEVELIQPLPMYEGMKFSFREGGKTVGHGVVSKILADEAPKKVAKPAAAAAGTPDFYACSLSSCRARLMTGA